MKFEFWFDHINTTEKIVLSETKTTPGYARGKEKLIARGEVDKKKAP
mgnify:CR=1 FL=1